LNWSRQGRRVFALALNGWLLAQEVKEEPKVAEPPPHSGVANSIVSVVHYIGPSLIRGR
jgi:hypothetical protein